MSGTTKIANRDVPVMDGEIITVRFSSGGQGKEEAGIWEFWTVFRKENGIVTKHFARCRQGSDPGERFRRMEGEKGYEEAWSVASTTDGIRPATQAEVGLWLKGHPKDARFAQSCQVGGKTIKLPKTADGFIIQEEP